ncbi:hypothetical protein AB0H29_01915 [Streptomyces thermolilacinus]
MGVVEIIVVSHLYGTHAASGDQTGRGNPVRTQQPGRLVGGLCISACIVWAAIVILLAISVNTGESLSTVLARRPAWNWIVLTLLILYSFTFRGSGTQSRGDGRALPPLTLRARLMSLGTALAMSVLVIYGLGVIVPSKKQPAGFAERTEEFFNIMLSLTAAIPLSLMVAYYLVSPIVWPRFRGKSTP